jgi:hypothetical protein
MFILDSLMISGIQWALKTVVAAAEAEMNDDTALREQLLEAEMRREMGEISDTEFADIEADLLARIRDIKERREGAGPLGFSGGEPMETSPGSTFQVEASVSGDFYNPADAPHTVVVETGPSSGQDVRILDVEPGEAIEAAEPGLPLSRTPRARRAARTNRATRATRTRPSSRPKRSTPK